MDKLKEFAKAIEGVEDDESSLNDVVSRNNNPGALRWSPFQSSIRNGFSYFKDYETGFKALCWDIKQKCLGNTKTGLNSESTILDFFNIYAPSSDKNNPLAYATRVSHAVNLTPSSRLKEIYPGQVETVNVVPETIDVIPVYISLHLVLDNRCRNYIEDIEKFLTDVREDYVVGTDGAVSLKWSISYKDLSQIEWETYSSQGRGPSKSWVANDTADIRILRGNSVDCVMYIIDEENWKSHDVFGWSLVGMVNGYTIQIVRGNRLSRNIYVEIAHELAHEHDDRWKIRFGRTLESYFGVASYDNDIVHKRMPGYISETPEYRTTLGQMRDLLIAMFLKSTDVITLTENQKQLIQISLSERIISLMYQLLSKLKEQHS